jgi:hypothetical protein
VTTSEIRYKDVPLHKITEFCTEWFRVYPEITLNFAPSLHLKASSNLDIARRARAMHELQTRDLTLKKSPTVCLGDVETELYRQACTN